MAIIQFRSADRQLALPAKTQLKSFLIALFKKEKVPLTNLTYIFCSDAFLLQMNKDFLQHDYYTDIITFELSEPNQPINAEIYISVDRVRDNAQEFNTSLKRELHRVIFHGALHLCGYKDKKKMDAALMRKMEEICLNRYFG